MDDITQKSIKKIALGTVQFGLNYGISNKEGRTLEREVGAILREAHNRGIDLLDTAHSYGDSEKILGDWIPNFHFRIISKFPRPEKGRSIKNYLQESLMLLKTDSLYGYMAHDAQCIIDEPYLWNELLGLREQKLVEKIGFSLYSPEQLQKLLQLDCLPDIVQVPYNVFDRRFESKFSELKKNGVEIHIRSVFLQGLFFISLQELPSYFDSVKPKLLKMKKRFNNNETLAESLLDFCFKNPMIDKVVIGVNNASQLISNLSISSLPIPDLNWDEFRVLDESILLPYRWPK